MENKKNIIIGCVAFLLGSIISILIFWGITQSINNNNSQNNQSQMVNNCGFIGYNMTVTNSNCGSGFEPMYSNGTIAWYPENGAARIGTYTIISEEQSFNDNYCYTELNFGNNTGCVAWIPTKDPNIFFACGCETECTSSNRWFVAFLLNKLED